MPDDPANMTDEEWEAFEVRHPLPPPADRRPFGDETCPVCFHWSAAPPGEACLSCQAAVRDAEIKRERRKQLVEQRRAARQIAGGVVVTGAVMRRRGNRKETN